MVWDKEIDEIAKRKQLARLQGGPDGVARQHQKGRLTIRERIARLLDTDSFREIGEQAGAAEFDDEGNLTGFTPANFVLGLGKIGGRPVAVGGEDFTLKGGSPNESGLRKSVYAEDLARQYKIPLVRLHEGGGGSVAGTSGKRRSAGEPVFARSRFYSMAALLGRVPVACAALGPVAGLPAARLVSSHFAVMSKNAQVIIAGPAVVERALGYKISKEDLGGPQVHAKSGTIDNVAETEEDALAQIACFLSYLPTNVWEFPPFEPSTDDPDRKDDKLSAIVPKDRRKPFNMRKILKSVVDQGSYFEMTRSFGPGQITALARLNGRPVGVFANDCMFYAGAMTADGAQKVRRFVDLCNTFHLPIISFVDEPGFMIGLESEQSATIRHGAAALASVVQSRVPWATVIVHKVFGVAGAAHFGPNGYVLSWPSAETGALPVEGGVAVAFGREIAQADNPDQKREELERAMSEANSPFPRAENLSVHDLIDPAETRSRLCQWIDWAWRAYTADAAVALQPHLVPMRP